MSRGLSQQKSFLHHLAKDSVSENVLVTEAVWVAWWEKHGPGTTQTWVKAQRPCCMPGRLSSLGPAEWHPVNVTVPSESKHQTSVLHVLCFYFP